MVVEFVLDESICWEFGDVMEDFSDLVFFSCGLIHELC